jgi:hypothetical protein
VCHAGSMEAAPPDVHHLHGNLAPWWPLISPADEREAEAAYVATLLHSARIGVGEVLELGSGPGHHAVHLGQHFAMTLVDARPDLLAVSRERNPQCRHVVGDMRSVRLAERFDGVFVHDAIGLMTCEDDLRAAVATAHAHCRRGGVAAFLPDHIRETFTGSSSSGGVDGVDGRGARYYSWTWDPDPSDTWVLTTRAFVLRHRDGTVSLCQETHRTGLFPRDVWLDVLTEAGFEGCALEEETDEEHPPRTVFVGHRPS